MWSDHTYTMSYMCKKKHLLQKVELHAVVRVCLYVEIPTSIPWRERGNMEIYGKLYTLIESHFILYIIVLFLNYATAIIILSKTWRRK